MNLIFTFSAPDIFRWQFFKIYKDFLKNYLVYVNFGSIFA